MTEKNCMNCAMSLKRPIDRLSQTPKECMYVVTHYNTGRIGGTDFHVLTSVLYDAMQDQREYETCDGCRWWKVRPQRCSCCRRNRALKDGYEKRKPEVPLP